MRSEIGDNRILPVENLATNPSFERVTPGTTVVRRNLAPYPKNFSFAGSGTSSAGLSSDRAWYGAQSFKAQTTSGSRGIQTPLYTVTPGHTYTLSFYTWTDTATNNKPAWTFSRDASYTSVGPMQVAPGSIWAPYTWVRFTYTYTVPDGVTQIRAYYTSGDTNLIVYADAILLEERPAILPFFDGSTVDNTGITYSWEGAANASTSVAKASVVELRRNLLLDPAVQASTLWGGYGGTAAPYTNGGDGSTYAYESLPVALTGFSRALVQRWTTTSAAMYAEIGQFGTTAVTGSTTYSA